MRCLEETAATVCRGRIARFLRNDSGNIALIAGISMIAIVPLAAIGIDIGSLYLERRSLQGLADLAAITAAANLPHPRKATRRFLKENGITDYTVMIVQKDKTGGTGQALDLSDRRLHVLLETGGYTADPAIAPDARFDRNKSAINAVKVTVRKQGMLFFGGGLVEPPLLSASGTAQAAAEASFSVGSRLLRVDGGILNALLNGFLGTSLSLDVMDYEALIDADIELLGFLDALATEIDFTAGTYDDLLGADITVADVTRAMARVSRGRPAAARALGIIAAERKAGDMTLQLGKLIGLGPLGRMATGRGEAAFESDINAMEMLTATAAVANGENQVWLDLGLSVPGIAGLTADLAIGEPSQFAPWYTVGREGTVVRTAQTRLFVEATVGGGGALAGATIRLPLYLELAYAEARLAQVSCPGGNPKRARVHVEARPGVADLWIADVDREGMKRFDDSLPTSGARLVKTALVEVRALAHLEVGNLNYTDLAFSRRDIDDDRVKTVSTRDFAGSIVRSLLGDMALEVKAGGLGLAAPGLVRSSLAAALEPLAKPLDEAIFSLLAALGIQVGQADIRVHGVKCGRAVLVQ